MVYIMYDVWLKRGPATPSRPDLAICAQTCSCQRRKEKRPNIVHSHPCRVPRAKYDYDKDYHYDLDDHGDDK